jgi:hypothetical protein
LKYEANPTLKAALFATAPSILVEASPSDTYWGVGLQSDDPKIHDQSAWRGRNKFGYLLTELRDEMMACEKSLPIIQSPQTVNESATDQLTRGTKRFNTPPSHPVKRTS